ncbi:TrbI/VirB10 family protein [Paraburkholderia sp. BCC1876]|uniref:TrbI/VirB10 family protein n=1 Tax=Paraburkholderia sp. BCC1876 TaxID=2676303 RepID=UPI0015911731|nr:TrbI/VirB10 family protein [Paraburkholderia sp. BCC1876]
MVQKRLLACTAMLLLFGYAQAQVPKVLQQEEPVILKATKPQPYEVASGTIIQVALNTADPAPGGVVIGMVSTNVYDYFENVVIPAGSKLIGKEVKQVNDRHEVLWDQLQIQGATFRLDPPIEATMPDGSTGVSRFALGAHAGAIVSHSFIVPH